jgi:hypothetical protein
METTCKVFFISNQTEQKKKRTTKKHFHFPCSQLRPIPLYNTDIILGTDGHQYQNLRKIIRGDFLLKHFTTLLNKKHVLRAAHTSGYYVKIRLNIINNPCGVPVSVHSLQACTTVAIAGSADCFISPSPKSETDTMKSQFQYFCYTFLHIISLLSFAHKNQNTLILQQRFLHSQYFAQMNNKHCTGYRIQVL